MTAYIYDTESLKIINRYKTMRGAKAALTRARNGGGLKYMASFGYGRIKGERLDRLDVCTPDEFDALDYDVEVKVLMGEKDEHGNLPTTTIKKSEVGGPCDPSTERYWCM